MRPGADRDVCNAYRRDGGGPAVASSWPEQAWTAVRVGRAVRDLGPGESVVVPPGIVHAFSNPADEPVCVITRETPAGQLEAQLRVMSSAGRLPRCCGWPKSTPGTVSRSSWPACLSFRSACYGKVLPDWRVSGISGDRLRTESVDLKLGGMMPLPTQRNECWLRRERTLPPICGACCRPCPDLDHAQICSFCPDRRCRLVGAGGRVALVLCFPPGGGPVRVARVSGGGRRSRLVRRPRPRGLVCAEDG
jgi:hypothetical protein